MEIRAGIDIALIVARWVLKYKLLITFKLIGIFNPDFIVPAPILFSLEHFLEYFSTGKTFLAGWFCYCAVVASGGNKFCSSFPFHII